MALAVVRDLREARVPAGPDEVAAFETDVLAGFVLARAAAGLADNTISADVPPGAGPGVVRPAAVGDAPGDADEYFGKVLRDAANDTRLTRAQALKTYFLFLELRHKVEIHQMTGRVAECPVDEMNRPRGGGRRGAADPAGGGAGGRAVRRVAGGAGDVPEVRPGRPQLRGGPADGRCRAAGQRGVAMLDLDDVQVGPGPVR